MFWTKKSFVELANRSLKSQYRRNLNTFDQNLFSIKILPFRQALVSPADIRIAYQGLPATNTLAYRWYTYITLDQFTR
jgi:hypothetical protein